MRTCVFRTRAIPAALPGAQVNRGVILKLRKLGGDTSVRTTPKETGLLAVYLLGFVVLRLIEQNRHR